MAELIINSNQPFPLNAPDRVILVQSGSIANSAIATTNRIPQSARRYLFDVNPGEVFFGIAPVWEGDSHQLIAVAYEETHRIYVIVGGQVVQQGNFEELMAQAGMFADLMARQMV